jgi:hypothetical protein
MVGVLRGHGIISRPQYIRELKHLCHRILQKKTNPE